MVTIDNIEKVAILCNHELSPEEREKFDYLDWEVLDAGEDSALFVRYRGEIYDLSDFFTGASPWGDGMPEALKDWDAYTNDSAFSGLVIRVDPEGDMITIGMYVC